MTGENLRSYIVTNESVLAALPTAASLGVVEQNKSDYDSTAPTTRIWFRRRSEEQDLGISGTELLCTTYYDIECISEDIADAETLASVLKGALHGHQGAIGEDYGTVFVEDHSDDYTPHNLSEDTGAHICALDVTILH